MNEAETRAEFIDPALKALGWGEIEGSQIRREFPITKGRLIGHGKRASNDIADYVLFYRNEAVAVIEAKSDTHTATDGLDQAKRYALQLETRFTYSTNGRSIYYCDMHTGEEGPVDNYPDPQTLWDMTYAESNEWRDRFSAVPFESKGGTWEGRYYQTAAIKHALKAVASRKNRILLTLATGTGKTFIAFQIAWKLFQSKWNLGYEANRRPRILFLADRNILADQAYNSFSSFDEDALARIRPEEIRKKGRVPKNASIFFTIFQTFMSGKNEEPYFGEYPKDFFDFIIIDECHRGGANDESNWRVILDYFSPAVQLGLTATPKRKDNVDTYAYFGEPVYIYSLKQGISDGFLTPFRVIQHKTSLDEYVHEEGDKVIEGEVEAGKVYEEREFNKSKGIEISARERKRLEIFLNTIDPNEKTLVFCKTQDHAGLSRDLINQMKESRDPNYCARVTADDGNAGETHLRAFQDNEKTIPTILTTSQKLSTGVDARNIRHIVLMREVNSIIEFKQIVGRGTRLYDGKDYFTVHDFVGAAKNFEDPDWDGEPIDPVQPDKEKPKRKKREREEKPEKQKLVIKISEDKEREIQVSTQTTFWSADGRQVSAQEFLQELYGELPLFFRSEDELRKIWSQPVTRQELLYKLGDKGLTKDSLEQLQKMIGAEKSDVFDLLSYISFESKIITRSERVEEHRELIFSNYDERKREFIDFVLSKYEEDGVDELSPDKLPVLLELKYDTLRDASDHLGSMNEIRETFVEFQEHLYAYA